VTRENQPWPLRRSDALFVVAVVLFALPDLGIHSLFGIPSTAIKIVLVVVAVSAWIRLRVFGRGQSS
jgi:hypothetical protein